VEYELNTLQQSCVVQFTFKWRAIIGYNFTNSKLKSKPWRVYSHVTFFYRFLISGGYAHELEICQNILKLILSKFKKQLLDSLLQNKELVSGKKQNFQLNIRCNYTGDNLRNVLVLHPQTTVLTYPKKPHGMEVIITNSFNGELSSVKFFANRDGF